MKGVLIASRIFLGLFLLANGLNFWFHWLPLSPPQSEAANRLMDGLVFSGLFGVVKYVEVLAGIALLANRFVPLALAAMMPLTVVICYVDYILIIEPRPIAFATMLVVPQAILMLFHLRSYLPLLAYRSGPAAPPSADEVRSGMFG